MVTSLVSCRAYPPYAETLQTLNGTVSDGFAAALQMLLQKGYVSCVSAGSLAAKWQLTESGLTSLRACVQLVEPICPFTPSTEDPFQVGKFEIILRLESAGWRWHQDRKAPKPYREGECQAYHVARGKEPWKAYLLCLLFSSVVLATASDGCIPHVGRPAAFYTKMLVRAGLLGGLLWVALLRSP